MDTDKKVIEEVSGNPDVDNQFNPAALRLSQSFTEMIGVDKAVLTIPVRKPHNQEFVRVNPDEAMCLQTAVLELKEDRETFLVNPSLWNVIANMIIAKILYVTLNRQNVLAIWPIRLPRSDGRRDTWNQSALEAADLGKKRWVRIASNMSLGAYEVFTATGVLPEPEWPDLTFQKILEIAFKDRFINSLDHPAIRRLQGEL